MELTPVQVSQLKPHWFLRTVGLCLSMLVIGNCNQRVMVYMMFPFIYVLVSRTTLHAAGPCKPGATSCLLVKLWTYAVSLMKSSRSNHPKFSCNVAAKMKAS